MPDLDIRTIYNRLRRYIFFLLAFYVLLWGFTPYKAVCLGLTLGTSLSLFNMWLLVKRMDRFSAAIDEGKALRSLGTVSRMATAVLAVLIALKFPEHLNIYSVIVGLMTSYIVIMIDFFVRTFNSRK